MNAVDTNVLLYVHDSREPAKQQQAISLVLSLTDGALLWQVACEYLAASRKLEPLGFNRSQAWQDIQRLHQVWTTILPTWSTLKLADQLLRQYSLSFWDALIVAACLEGGVNRLYSENFDAYPRIDNLEIVNPFKTVT
ncbi:MAG: PIN domain-containing protein [Candidatus Caldarchaeum sp.]